MDETRVERYKEYRNSFIKEGSIAPTSEDEPTTINVKGTTTTLPIEEVIDAVQEDKQREALQKQSKRKHLIIVLVKVVVAIVLLSGLALLGYFAWR